MERRRALWQNDAQCVNQSESIETTDFCKGCPVRKQCRQYGLLHEEHEIFGGMTPEQRRVWRKTFKDSYAALAETAFKEGWLEPHNLVDRDVLQDLIDQAEIDNRAPEPVVEFTPTRVFIAPSLPAPWKPQPVPMSA